MLVRTAEMMAGVLGHDLRNPLGAIVSSAEVLRLLAPDDEQMQKIARAIQEGAKAFLVTLVLMPVLMSGSGVLAVVFRKLDEGTEKKYAVIDRPEGSSSCRKWQNNRRW